MHQVAAGRLRLGRYRLELLRLRHRTRHLRRPRKASTPRLPRHLSRLTLLVALELRDDGENASGEDPHSA